MAAVLGALLPGYAFYSYTVHVKQECCGECHASLCLKEEEVYIELYTYIYYIIYTHVLLVFGGTIYYYVALCWLFVSVFYLGDGLLIAARFSSSIFWRGVFRLVGRALGVLVGRSCIGCFC